MKRLCLALLVFTGLCSHAFSGPFEPNEDPPLEDVLSPKEFRKYLSKPCYRDRMDLFREVIERRQASLNRSVAASRMEGTLNLLKGLRALSRYITQETSKSTHPKDMRSRQVRKLEISIRNLIEAIDGFKQIVSFRYQLKFEAASQALQISRSRLLVQIFGEAMASRSQQSERSARLEVVGILKGFFRPALAARAGNPSSEPPSGPMDDRFTEKELEMIRANLKLVARVDSFLKIAEARLKEVHRRLEKKEWKEKEENPLEFHTFHDLIHAYERAIDSTMTYIDESAGYQTAKQKDIKKSLKNLNKKILEFLPQLAPLKERAIQLQDEELYNAVIKAKETSDIAKEGSELALSLE